MALTKLQKQKIIDNLRDTIKKSKSLVLINIMNLKTNDFGQLKSELKLNQMNTRVVKKTLLGLALKKQGYENFDLNNFKYGVAAIFSKDEPIKMIKILDGFVKKVLKKTLKDILALAFIDKELEEPSKVIQFAMIPERPELYAKLRYALNYSMQKLDFDLKTLGGLKLINTLKALARSKS